MHQRATLSLARLLCDACPPDFEVLIAPFAVRLAGDTEALSHSTKLIDLNVKKERLRRPRTPSYWVVDPAARPAETRLIAWSWTTTRNTSKLPT